MCVILFNTEFTASAFGVRLVWLLPFEPFDIPQKYGMVSVIAS